MSFSCVLLGETTLLRRCAALLRAQGWSIGAVASNDEGNRAWAISENILCCGLDSKLHEHLAKVSFDYLFSIVNPVVLKTEVLNLPIEGAINFHDSLLPAYAGTHATSWAILNQEIAHGISWHEISSNIDGGQVYVQVPVAIGPRMTAHQLNAACYDAALAGFETLLAQIQSKSLQGLDQDRSQRSYFGRYEGPPDGGFIRWSKSAKELDALVRSTDFGPSDNTFGSAKLLLPDAAIVVVEATADGHSSHPPGTIVGCVHSLSVSTGHGLLRISRLRSLDGAELTVEQFVREYGLSQGAVLPVLSDVEAKKYRKSHNAAAKIEATWINSVADIEIPKFFFASSDRTGVAVDGQSDSISLLSPLKFDDWSDQYEVAARVCLFLRRLVRIDSFDVGFFSERESCCFAPSLPLRVNVSLSETIDCALARLKTAWEAIGKTKGLLLDSLMRYRATRSESSLQTLCNFPVVFAFTTSQNIEAVKSQLVPVSPLLAVIISDDGTVNFAWNRLGSRGYDRARFNELAQAFLVDIQLHSDEALENVPWRNDISVNSERPGVARSRDLTFLDYFSASVSRFSNSVAMTFDGVSLNYCELDVDSTRLAVELQRLGVTKGSRVAVFVQRSHRMIVAMLAILKAGASYVPMDTAVPEDRTRSILEDCVPQVVIADSTTEPALSFSGLTILVLDREPDSKSEMSLQSFGASSEEEAYLLYTSGSTGRPKGVVVTHGNLAAFIAAALPNYQNTSGRPMIAQLSIAFDASLAEIVLPLSCGGSLAVFSRETVTDTLQFRDHLEKGDYHFLITVPSQVRALLEAGWTGRGVRGVNIGGEPLTHELSKRLFSVKPPELRVVNMYGPTETTIGITRYELETAGMYEESSLTEPIGLPLDGAQLRIVDEGLRALPWGVPGEILLGGEFVAAGYLGRPDLTRAKFVSHPEMGRIYRTGDLARQLPDGSVEFLGRIDQQVKVRGVRIELGEIKAAISRHPGVRDCAVCAFDSLSSNKEIVAYYVGDVPSAEIKEYLSRHLSKACLPSALMSVEYIPLTPSGKIAREKLPKPSLRLSSRPFVPPRNVTEFKLAALWEELLSVGSVGVLDDFFELGGHSLSAVSLISAIAEKFGQKLGFGVLVEHATLETLAAFLDQGGDRGPWSPFVPLTRRDGDAPGEIFLVHPFGGTVFCYGDVARSLSTSFSVVGIQALGAEFGQEPFSSVSRMATYYLSEISKRGTRVLAIGGYSFGGLVAFEMLRQLELAGEERPALVILDTPSPSIPHSSVSTRDEIAFLVDLFSPFIPLEITDIRSRGDLTAQFEYVLTKLRESYITPPGFTLDKARNFLRLYQAHEVAWGAFRPVAIESKIHLIRSKEVDHERFVEYRDDVRLGWQAFTSSGVELHAVPDADHQTILSATHSSKVASVVSQLVSN